jgi:hypothetical protein
MAGHCTRCRCMRCRSRVAPPHTACACRVSSVHRIVTRDRGVVSYRVVSCRVVSSRLDSTRSNSHLMRSCTCGALLQSASRGAKTQQQRATRANESADNQRQGQPTTSEDRATMIGHRGACTRAHTDRWKFEFEESKCLPMSATFRHAIAAAVGAVGPACALLVSCVARTHVCCEVVSTLIHRCGC